MSTEHVRGWRAYFVCRSLGSVESGAGDNQSGMRGVVEGLRLHTVWAQLTRVGQPTTACMHTHSIRNATPDMQGCKFKSVTTRFLDGAA
jgi:hypothetical protein